MGLQTAPAYIGDPGFDHPVELDRNLLEGLFGRTGRLRPGDFTVGVVPGALQVTVSSGRAFLLGGESNMQGGYFVWSENGETLAWPSPAGSPRIDTLLLRVRDNQYGTIGGSLGADWDIVSGTPASSPTAVADAEFNSGGDFYEPGAWWRVADIRINPGDTQVNSGLVTAYTNYVRNSLYRSACLSSLFPTDAVTGDLAFATDTGQEWYWSGSKWLSARPNFVWKTADETVNTTTTLQSDNHLFFPVEANSRYVVAGMLIMKTGPSDPDVKFTWQMPTGATATGQFRDRGQDHITSDQSPAVGDTSSGGPVPHGVDFMIVTGANAGTVTLRWTENVASSTATMAQDSWISWQKIG